MMTLEEAVICLNNIDERESFESITTEAFKEPSLLQMALCLRDMVEVYGISHMIMYSLVQGVCIGIKMEKEKEPRGLI